MNFSAKSSRPPSLYLLRLHFLFQHGLSIPSLSSKSQRFNLFYPPPDIRRLAPFLLGLQR